jgi:hypothetical protein
MKLDSYLKGKALVAQAFRMCQSSLNACDFIFNVPDLLVFEKKLPDIASLCLHFTTSVGKKTGLIHRLEEIFFRHNNVRINSWEAREIMCELEP